MSSLQGSINDNFGGNQWAKWANVAFVDQVNLRYDGSVSDVTFTGDYTWEEFPISLETIDVKQQTISSVSGESFKTLVECFVPGSIATYESKLQAMVHSKFLLAVNDWDDLLLVAGTKENACNCTINFDSQSRVSGLKGTKISFLVTSRILPHRILRSVLFP